MRPSPLTVAQETKVLVKETCHGGERRKKGREGLGAVGREHRPGKE